MLSDKVIVCLCRDVTLGDVERAVAAGYSDLETIKRFTGAFTGPCQGQTCADAIRRLVAQLMGCALEDVPEPVARPPVAPLRMGTLAAREEGES
jgi:NAD(P)H-nitrite reductase large subunit